LKFLVMILIWFSMKKIIQYSRTFTPQVQTSWNQANAPLLVESFSKDTKNMMWNAWVWWISQLKNKRNYLTSQITSQTFNITKFQQNPCKNHKIICPCKI
jgi:hypothetical protein